MFPRTRPSHAEEPDRPPGSVARTAPDSSARCPHCGTPVEGPDDVYCCHGCELAADLIRDAGLEKYYERREKYAPRPGALGDGWESVPVEQDSAGVAQCRVMVDGLRCASCVWVTENLLRETPGVVETTVSYATGRATLRWDPTQVSLRDLAGRIAALGYRPRLLGEYAAEVVHSSHRPTFI